MTPSHVTIPIGRLALVSLFTFGASWAQEAGAGFDLRATVTAGLYEGNTPTLAPREGASWVAGARAMLYPTWKISDHWSMSGAVQVRTRPFFREEMQTQGYGLKADVLQGTLNYS